MEFEQEKLHAYDILAGIEQGTHSTLDSYYLLKEADPTLVYFIFTWLRAHYGANHPAAEGVIGRVVEICGAHPEVAKMAKEGESDVVVGWFEEAHSYRELDAADFIALIVEKLEG